MDLKDIIEENRSQSSIDPAIYGIVYRLWLLDFISHTGLTCSGHAENFGEDYRWTKEVDDESVGMSRDEVYNNGVERFVRSGCLMLNYRLDSYNEPDARKFHQWLVNHKLSVQDGIQHYGIGVSTGPSYALDFKFDESAWGCETEFDNSLNVNYYVQIDLPTNPSAIPILYILREFWQRFSDYLTQFEKEPVHEKIKAEYFTQRGDFPLRGFMGAKLLLPPGAEEKLIEVHRNKFEKQESLRKVIVQ